VAYPIDTLITEIVFATRTTTTSKFIATLSGGMAHIKTEGSESYHEGLKVYLATSESTGSYDAHQILDHDDTRLTIPTSGTLSSTTASIESFWAGDPIGTRLPHSAQRIYQPGATVVGIKFKIYAAEHETEIAQDPWFNVSSGSSGISQATIITLSVMEVI
jgi:hypothetical protein